ncbi:MAG: hypothetical protein A4E72_00417 [Syntrophus sp. PtaU1.Bin208]|nr:MAG: hypothetical protein A4E72_00417 [Syntrophus sp. PtaU1.Bin208]
MIEAEEIKSWIINGPDREILKSIDQFSERIAHNLKKTPIGQEKNDESVTRAQIRQIFSKMKTIEAKGIKDTELLSQKSEFLMLKPLIAYAAGRHNKKGLTEFKKVLSTSIDYVTEATDDKEWKKRFKNFCKLFEAILAYHRAHGGN